MCKQGARLSEDFHEGENKWWWWASGKTALVTALCSLVICTHWLCTVRCGPVAHAHTALFFFSSCQCTRFERVFLSPIPQVWLQSSVPSPPFNTKYITPSERHNHMLYKNGYKTFPLALQWGPNEIMHGRALAQGLTKCTKCAWVAGFRGMRGIFRQRGRVGWHFAFLFSWAIMLSPFLRHCRVPNCLEHVSFSLD